MAAESFGVLIDFGARRRVPQGVPSYFDGWYASEEDAVEASNVLQQTHPRARVFVIRVQYLRGHGAVAPATLRVEARLGGGPRDKKSTLLARAWLKPR
jgi:hypothetical protein